MEGSHLTYEILGFKLIERKLVAVLKQPYIVATEITDLNSVKEFMQFNGFNNTRNNDYCNADLGVILEDLHDENVLTSEGVLQFIDTVFYLTGVFHDDSIQKL